VCVCVCARARACVRVFYTDSYYPNTNQLRPLGSAFVAFTDLRSAITATRVQHTKDVDSLLVSRCPEPRDVVWSNIGMPLKLRQLRRLAMAGVSVYMVCFMMVPVAFVASLANLDNLARVLPFLTAYLEHHPSTKGFIQGFLPSLVLALFVNQVPNFLPVLAKLEGIPSQSAIDSWVLSKFFYFQLFNVFLGVTVSTGKGAEKALQKGHVILKKRPPDMLALRHARHHPAARRAPRINRARSWHVCPAGSLLLRQLRLLPEPRHLPTRAVPARGSPARGCQVALRSQV
jgi:hypothetical protein